MRLLVIEDFSPLREALVQGLTESGFAVDAADNGEDGLRYARVTAYDVIVLDLMLPGIDGLSLLTTLRQAHHPARVLVLTARDTPQDRVRGLNLGADDYLIKPFDFAELWRASAPLFAANTHSPAPPSASAMSPSTPPRAMSASPTNASN